jgi:L-gulonolactone oxidase
LYPTLGYQRSTLPTESYRIVRCQVTSGTLLPSSKSYSDYDRKTTVNSFGSRHSQTDIICTDGIPVDTIIHPSFKNVHPLTNRVKFGSGLILHEAIAFLRLKVRVFRTTPAYGNITIGGAIGAGANGSTLKYNASISSQVSGLTVVDGFGEIQYIT